MRLRVQVRYRVDTGEVEIFQVEDVPEGSRLPDHDARHDRAAQSLGRIIDPHAQVIEEDPASAVEPAEDLRQRQATEETASTRGPVREGPQR